MALFSTDRDWEKLGRRDPYWAVLTQDRFHGAQFDAERRSEFFKSGQADVDELFSVIHGHLDASFAPASALDFGCGVGRLSLALADRCGRVVGVDVAPGMVAEADKNRAAQGRAHVRFIQGDDQLSRVTETFDLIVSRMVFQHIPPARGELILERLLTMLNRGGIGSLHFYCGPRAALVSPPVAGWKDRLCRLRAGWTRACLRLRGQAVIEMHAYDLNRVMARLAAAGCRAVHCQLREQKVSLAATVYFAK